MPRTVLGVVLSGAAVLPACGWRYGYNFLDPTAPRFASAPRAPQRAFGNRFKLVSFNVKFGDRRRTLRAIRYLQTDSTFRDPDVLLLQEVNCRAVEAIANALGANWVYYPAAWHPQGTQWPHENGSQCPGPVVEPGGYFGVGIVSPWNILDDQKIPLPHLSRSDDAQKVAVAATIDFGGAYRLRALNVHLQSGLTPVQVGDQVQAITACVLDERCPAGAQRVSVETWAPGPRAAGPPGNVVFAGDFNSPGDAHIRVIKTLFSGRAEQVPLPRGTFWLVSAFTSLGRLDHVFHGAELRPGAGKVGTTKISDHRPVAVEFTVDR